MKQLVNDSRERSAVYITETRLQESTCILEGYQRIRQASQQERPSSRTSGVMFVPCRIGPHKTPTEIEATAEREIYATFPLSAFMPRNATCFPAMIRERVGCAVYSSTPVHHGLRRNRSTRNGIQRSRVLTSEVLVPRQGEPTVIRAGVAVGSSMRPIRRRIPSPSHPREPQVRRPKGQHPGQRSGRREQST